MDQTRKTLGSYVLGHAWKLVIGVILIAFPVGLSLLLPFLIRFTIDELNAGTLDGSRLLFFAATYLVGSSISALISLLMRRMPLYISHRVEADMRQDLFEHLCRMDTGFYHRARTGDLMTRMTSDLSSVREFLGQGILQGTRTFLVFLIAFSIMFSISVELSLILAGLLPVISVMMFVLLRMIRPRYEMRQEQFSTLSNFTQEAFSGIRTVKGYGLEPLRMCKFEEHNLEFIRRNMALSRVERPIWPLMMFLFTLGTVLMLVVGGRLVIEGQITLGALVQFNQYLLYMTWPIIALGWTLNLTVRGLASWKRIQGILRSEPGITDGDWTDRGIAGVQGDIEFQHVCLRLDGRTILDDVSLHIPEGSAVGITGPTGSGKTMLVSLIPRLMEPSSGQVRIGGYDVRAHPLSLLRSAIGVAQQEPFLFSDTVAANLAFGLDEAHRETTHWAADVAELTRDVELFPQGFETVLGERGVTLSGGQRQRTAIGRAVARNPDILILDDVLSAVDTETEARILGRLREVLRERTSILVSHRVSTLRGADWIVVLENGRITQVGTHNELVERPGYYRDLVEIQRLEASLEATE